MSGHASSVATTSSTAPRLPTGEAPAARRALTVGYDGIPILPALTLTVGAGELWAVIGPNGAGKSTFVRTALGLTPPVAGTIERRPGLRLAYVPQQSALDAIFPVSVLDFVLMGLQGTDNVTLANPRAYLGRARAALAEAGAEALERRQLRDLSGGQRQRVLMARALATDADLIFLDEPTAALDASAEQEVLELIQRLRELRGAAVVMVTHLVEDGLERADHALLLDRDHRVAFAATAAAMRSAPDFEHIYARFVGRRAEQTSREAGEAVSDTAATWHELFANLGIFRDAILAGGLAGALLGFLGVHVVLRRMVFASSAIAQAAALGVALSFWVPAVIDPLGHAAGHAAGPGGHVIPSPLFQPVLWAIAASLLATLVFIANPVRLHLTRESMLGFVFLASGAGAVIIGDRITQDAHDLTTILFGSAVVVQTSDLYWIGAATVVLLGGHLVLWRALLFVGYDPLGAEVQGMPVRALNGFLFVSVGLAVALCTRALGALPVFAFSVLPAMTALALTSRIGLCFVLATAFGAFSGVAGYAVSFRAELPVGATETAMAAALLAAALAWRYVGAQRDRRRARQSASGAADAPRPKGGPMLSVAIVCLLAQQIDQRALEKAMAADAAAKAAAAPARRRRRRPPRPRPRHDAVRA